MEDRRAVRRRHLKEDKEILLAYLFGSQAEGTAGPQSDYDIALLVRQPSRALQARLAHEIGIILGTDRVDVVLLNRAPVELGLRGHCSGAVALPAERGRAGGV